MKENWYLLSKEETIEKTNSNIDGLTKKEATNQPLLKCLKTVSMLS